MSAHYRNVRRRIERADKGTPEENSEVVVVWDPADDGDDVAEEEGEAEKPGRKRPEERRNE